MTSDELEALSNAATQGVCEVLAPDTEHDFGVPLVATDYPGTFGPTNGMVLWATMQPTEIDAKDTSRAEANAAFTAALWNAYRQGQLILVDDAAVERVSAAIHRTLNADDLPEGGWAGICRDAATAAIAAMGGK